MSDEVKEMVILAMDYVAREGGEVKVNNLYISYDGNRIVIEV